MHESGRARAGKACRGKRPYSFDQFDIVEAASVFDNGSYSRDVNCRYPALAPSVVVCYSALRPWFDVARLKAQHGPCPPDQHSWNLSALPCEVGQERNVQDARVADR
jgi:hypothetical protein